MYEHPLLRVSKCIIRHVLKVATQQLRESMRSLREARVANLLPVRPREPVLRSAKLRRGKMRKGIFPDREVNPVDAYVGFQIRLRRTMIGMSAKQLADAIGVEHQQIAKYETARVRVGAGRLYRIASALRVPVGDFFQGAEDFERSRDLAAVLAKQARSKTLVSPDRLVSREALAFVRSLLEVRDTRTFKAYARLLLSVAVFFEGVASTDRPSAPHVWSPP